MPTPVAAQAVVELKLAGTVIITASHNPGFDLGLKFSPSHGGAAPKDITDAIGNAANSLTGYNIMPLSEAIEAKLVEYVNRRAAYLAYLKRVVPQAFTDIAAYAKTHPEFGVICDAMYGTAIEYFTDIFGAQGLDILKDLLHDHINPNFNDANKIGSPNPTLAEWSKDLDAAITAAQAAGKNHIGLAADGDSDRFVATGINSGQLIALLTYFLHEQGVEGDVWKTIATTSLVNAVALLLGIKTLEGGVGFKNTVGHLNTGEVVVAGESSAHVGAKPTKDSWDDAFAL
jgi:phosphoglucomutase